MKFIKQDYDISGERPLIDEITKIVDDNPDVFYEDLKNTMCQFENEFTKVEMRIQSNKNGGKTMIDKTLLIEFWYFTKKELSNEISLLVFCLKNPDKIKIVYQTLNNKINIMQNYIESLILNENSAEYINKLFEKFLQEYDYLMGYISENEVSYKGIFKLINDFADVIEGYNSQKVNFEEDGIFALKYKQVRIYGFYMKDSSKMFLCFAGIIKKTQKNDKKIVKILERCKIIRNCLKKEEK